MIQVSTFWWLLCPESAALSPEGRLRALPFHHSPNQKGNENESPPIHKGHRSHVGPESQHGMHIMTRMTQMIQNDCANIAV